MKSKESMESTVKLGILFLIFFEQCDKVQMGINQGLEFVAYDIVARRFSIGQPCLYTVKNGSTKYLVIKYIKLIHSPSTVFICNLDYVKAGIPSSPPRCVGTIV